MRIPKYWQRRAAQHQIRGEDYLLSGWGSSDRSEAEAAEAAERRILATRAAIERGERRDHYDYHADAIRELRLSVHGPEEDPEAILTRNGYGAKVLNAARVMFVDVDVEQARPGFFQRLFGKKRPSGKEAAVARVETWVRDHPETGFRIYETPAGLRLLATGGLHDPVSEATDRCLAELGADPLYRRLCRSQACFRARLSAKPWRIAMRRPPARFPTPEEIPGHAWWCAAYDAKAAGYAACRFLKAVGRDGWDAEVGRIVSLHDEASGALGNAPLA